MADLAGADRITRDLKDMIDRADLAGFWQPYMAPLWRKRQQTVAFERLAPLSEESVRIKRVHKTDPMVETGRLQRATYRYTPIRTRKGSAWFGIPKGGDRKSIGAMHATRSGSRPRRDVVPNWSKAERIKILDMLTDYLLRGKQ